MTKQRFAAALAAVFLGLLGGFGGGPAAARERLTIGVSQFPPGFNPLIESSAVLAYIHGLTRRPITAYDADWKLVCMLCTELPSAENGRITNETRADGKPGKAVRLTIRPDLFWADGTKVTSADIRFTWEMARHPLSGVTNSDFFTNDILDITVIDEKNLIIHRKDRCDAADMADFFVMPAHLERPVFAADAKEYRNRTLYNADTLNPGLYNGPYRIAQIERGSFVVLERNPHWKGARAPFETITVRAIENTAALQTNLLSGQVDLIAGEIGLSLDQAMALANREKQRFQVLIDQSLYFEHIELNLDHPALADRRVRRALLLGIDRAALNAQLFAGQQPPALSFLNPREAAFSEAVTAYAFDPAASDRLLDEAGWARGPDGMRRNAAGAKLALEFATTAGMRSREQVQQILQRQWRERGIDIQIRNQPPRVLFGRTLDRREFTGLAMFAWVAAPNQVPRTVYHASAIPSEANNWSGQNYAGWRNEEVNTLIEALETRCEPDAQRNNWARLQAVFTEELPQLPLWFRANALVLPTWLAGVRPTGHQYPSTLWIEEWRAEGG
jgi:peptide/nickel transport system substrate-binding protein